MTQPTKAELTGRSVTQGAMVALFAAVTLLAHASRYYPFFADDALISLRYSVRLATGLGLTWTDGEFVEGYSNPLWVLACALPIRLGADPILTARALGLTCGVGAITSIALVYRGAAAWIAGLGIAFSGPIAVWSVGGLEQPMVCLFLAMAVAWLLPRLDEGPVWPAGLALCGLTLSRPDSPLFVAIITVLLWRWRGPRAALAVGAPPALAWVAWECFRLAYYEDWLPNTAYAKVSPSWHRLGEGLIWVGTGALWLAPLVLVSLFAWRQLHSRRVILLASLVFAWHAYVAWIGGDIFPAHRHWAPAIVLHAALAAEALRIAADRTAAAIAVVTIALQAALAWLDPQNQRAADEVWEWQCADVGVTLRQAFGAQRPLLGADPAGCLPYFSELPSIDLFGLNDRWLAHHPPADLGDRWIGHGLGDGAYVYGRTPDLVVLCTPWGAERGCGRSGRELVAMPDFKRRYRLLRLQSQRAPNLPDHPATPEARIWARLDGPLGPTAISGGGYAVSPFWLSANGATTRLEGDVPVASVPSTARVKLGLPGAFTVDVVGDRVTDARYVDGTLEVAGRDAVVRRITLIPSR
jgi:arabinofuranosyltransferase